ncbi:MAG: hypothetical protein A2117_00730 [Candidatus Wildermuthbacteria bacterium GWA2_46_15]|uniref:Uncharacterized protein n=1 Tax=Candidatus Wildermuthbacteria bacterium GWA2_46_15 TaxID=1802443 RepID=A0A1G2QNL8_9BACT|nr:MAG: hypothetical protein A2117_00730 [Candidatus Wildermuthbacteria bacterium GWA2_46_15]
MLTSKRRSSIKTEFSKDFFKLECFRNLTLPEEALSEKCIKEIGLAQSAEPRLPNSPSNPRPIDRSIVESAIQKRENLLADSEYGKRRRAPRPVFLILTSQWFCPRIWEFEVRQD